MSTSLEDHVARDAKEVQNNDRRAIALLFIIVICSGPGQATRRLGPAAVKVMVALDTRRKAAQSQEVEEEEEQR